MTALREGEPQAVNGERAAGAPASTSLPGGSSPSQSAASILLRRIGDLEQQVIHWRRTAYALKASRDHWRHRAMNP